MAQNFCPTSTTAETGGFTVQPQVCAGKPVTITGVPASLANIRYVYQYSGNGIPGGVATTSYIYTNPGSYTILQVAAGSNATGTFACRVVEVLPVALVSFSTTTCSNGVVRLTYKLDAETIRYNFLSINWGDGTPTSTVVLNGSTTTGTITHTYTGTAVNYVVQVSGSYTNACTSVPAVQNVKLQTTSVVDPNILALTSDATKATVDFQGPDGYSLELYQKDAGGIYAPTGLTGTSGGSFSIPANPATANCFQLVAKDACGGSERRSTEVCSLVITGTAEDKQNVLKWQPYAGKGGTFDTYRVYRNSGPPIFSARNQAINAYTDIGNITCNKSYCYILEAIIRNTTTSPTTVRSMSTCVSGSDNGSVVSPTSAYVSVQPNGVNVQATLPTLGLPSPYTLVITRADGAGSAFNPLGIGDDRSYLDATAQTNSQSYCYQVAIRNSCGALSKPTAPACTILLTKNPNGSISWTSASPYSNEPPQNYQVIFIDPVTGASDKKSLGNVTTYQPDPDSQVTQYQIAAINKAGIESYSNPAEVELGLRVFVPNAFTPNGDAQNQSFMAKGLMAFWDTFEMTVYSRWGDVVYNSTDKNTTGWNGEVNGSPATSGYYGYRIRVIDSTGRAFERTGQVLLIR
ncbi:T9SS type B sorting domain-containing protein [Fibrella forsythiae]|uniref:Gliding motility-associated C-terminal domain-containing protein n=1 Tax=Fibrella forsythiae TaxID=2817061 RepID=A0ABS3JQ29_9BACT|nr:gliding motility-associated C-terminal domain-containing protein [Fibrella forsythiae]MBO0952100.1 gliding motility-associated C-terminal domain-containing protein [Fibrella forsythiae]